MVRFITLELNGGLADVSYKQPRYDKARVMHDYESEAMACRERFTGMFY